MPDGLAVALIILAVVLMVVVPPMLSKAIGSAAGSGVDKAIAAHNRRQPSRMWLVPGELSASSLRDTVRAHIATTDDTPVIVEVVVRKGREAVECSIAPGADAEALRAGLLRAARRGDATCTLELP